MPNYPRPPIIEAVIDIRLADSLRESALDKITHKLQKKYPAVQDCTNDLQLKLETLKPKPKVKFVSGSRIGRRFSRSAGDSVVQVYPDQFIFSMFARYEGWDVYKKHFDEAIKYFLPKSGANISRIGMRYINRIDIPSDTNKIKIDEYIKLSFNIPIAKTVEGFETALRFKMSDKYSSIVRTHTGESPLAEHVAIFVDIDVFYNLAMAVEIERLDEELVELRAAKNQLFEDMVTDKSRQLFLKEIES